VFHDQKQVIDYVPDDLKATGSEPASIKYLENGHTLITRITSILNEMSPKKLTNGVGSLIVL
jgi:hypothetical protein